MSATTRLVILIGAVAVTAACGAARAPMTTTFARLPDHLNVGDAVTVDAVDGTQVSGQVVRMAPDALVVRGPSAERIVDASGVLRIAACCDSLQNGTLIGLGSGAAFGVLFAAGFSDNGAGEDAIVGALVFGGIGAGLGVGLDALVRGDRLIYGAPAVTPRAHFGLRGGAVGVTVTW